jgi:hypothetical protein
LGFARLPDDQLAESQSNSLPYKLEAEGERLICEEEQMLDLKNEAYNLAGSMGFKNQNNIF